VSVQSSLALPLPFFPESADCDVPPSEHAIGDANRAAVIALMNRLLIRIACS
jgi:hypothetical protein